MKVGITATAMVFKHRDPVTAVEQLSWTDGRDSGRTELDPVGADVGTYQPINEDPGNDMPLHRGRPEQPFDHCAVNGLPDTCSGYARELSFWDSRIADLPGFGTNWGSLSELAEWLHGQRLIYTNGRNGIVRRRAEREREQRPTFFYAALQQSKQPEVIWIRLDFEQLKGLINDTLKYGDCEDYVARLIKMAASMPNDGGYYQPEESTNVLGNLERIRKQSTGGIYFQNLSLPHPHYPNVYPGSGGRGWAWGSFLHHNATINVQPDGYYRSNPERKATVLHTYGITGLHEVIHMSASWGTYGEKHLTRAAQALEPKEQISDWDEALKRHCLPPEYR